MKGVEISISKDINSKYYLSPQGHSAAFTALNKNKYEIFAFLKSSGADLKTGVERSSIDDNLSENQKDSLKKAMIPYFPSFETAHLYYLISKSRSQKQTDDFVFKIKDYFKKLGAIPEVLRILQVVQYADYLDIVFDFDNDSIKHINPTASEFTKGTTDYKEGRLYIAAKMEESTILGTLAHELTHLAMEMVYKNNCLPYKSTDNLSENKFKNIFQDIRNNDCIKKSGSGSPSGFDSPMKVIATTFSYPKHEQESELIVRVPHVLSQYYEIKDKKLFCSEERACLNSLFDFYQNEVMSSCDAFIKYSYFIKPRNFVKSLNETFGEISHLEETNVCFKESIDLNSFLNNTHSKSILVLYTNCTHLVVSNIYETLKRFLTHDSYLVLKFGNYLKYYEDIGQAFYSEACTLLILECPLESDCNQLYTKLHKWFDLLKEKVNKKIIIVIHEEKRENFEKNQFVQQCFFEPIRKVYNYSLHDLTIESQEKVMNKIIEFQGKKVFLRDIMIGKNENCLILVETNILMKLLSGQNVIVGKEPPISSGYANDFYLYRTFNWRIEIHKKIEEKNKIKEFKDKLVFEEQEFLSEKCEEYNVHWLERDKGKFIWKNSKGSISELLTYKINIKDHGFERQSTKTHLIKEEELINYFKKHRIIIISDIAGMGKTTVLTSLSIFLKSTNPKFWVMRINLNLCTNVFDEEINNRKFGGKKRRSSNKKTENNNEAIHILLKLLGLDEISSPETAFERKLLEYNLEIKLNVILLLDGFDEISPDYKDLVIELIKVLEFHVEKIVITTRPHMSLELESAFNIFACTLNPLSELEQVDFLVKFWQKCNPTFTDKKRLEVYAKNVIDLFTNTINDKFKEFTGVPLQSRMIGEIFMKNAERPTICDLLEKNSMSFKRIESLDEFYFSSKQKPLFSEKVSLLDLYELFIYKKYCDIYESEKKNALLSNLGTKDIKKAYPKFEEEHSELAVYSIFSRKQSKFLLKEKGFKNVELLINDVVEGEERRGIVDQVFDGKPFFIHQTFAEYFVTKFIIFCLEKNPQDYRVPQFLCNNILLKPEHSVIRAFLNKHLALIKPDKKKTVLETYGNQILYQNL